MPLSKQAPALPGNHPATSFHWLPDEILHLPYFHPDIHSSEEATSYIKKNAKKPGSFLLRTSSKGENFLSLSISVGQVHHVQVCVVKPNGIFSYYIVPELVFKKFDTLQAYYAKHRIGNLENVDNVKLLHPLVKRTRTASLPNIESPVTGILKNKGVSRRTSDLSDSSSGRGQNRATGMGKNLSGSSFDYKQRPPQPLPSQPIPEGTNPYYTRPQDVEVNRASELAELLRNSERCDCGLLLSEAELGSGWAVHKSRDTLTIGKIFFQNATGETSWLLPESVLTKLSPDKLEFLVKLYHESNQKLPFDLEQIQQLNTAFMF